MKMPSKEITYYGRIWRVVYILVIMKTLGTVAVNEHTWTFTRIDFISFGCGGKNSRYHEVRPVPLSRRQAARRQRYQGFIYVSSWRNSFTELLRKLMTSINETVLHPHWVVVTLQALLDQS